MIILQCGSGQKVPFRAEVGPGLLWRGKTNKPLVLCHVCGLRPWLAVNAAGAFGWLGSRVAPVAQHAMREMRKPHCARGAAAGKG